MDVDEQTKQRSLEAEVQRLKRQPVGSIYASHRLRVAQRALKILSTRQQMRSEEEAKELEQLLAGLSL